MRCDACFEENEQCNCGDAKTGDAFLLPLRHTLCGGQYVIGKILGSPGGFGITYLAFDTRLDIKVAIKEYLPRHLARRTGDTTVVECHTQSDEANFATGLSQFLSEAKTIANLRHPNIVRVLNYFEENATGYIVMDYLEGETLQEYMNRTGKIRFEDALELVLPILNALEYLHEKGILYNIDTCYWSLWNSKKCNIY